MSFKARSEQTNITDFSLQYSKEFSLWHSKLAFASLICSVHVRFLRLYSWLLFVIIVLYCCVLFVHVVNFNDFNEY